jgi:CMP-N-acetylneuraminic acid synthetase
MGNTAIIIPARGGSKGLKKKNLQRLGSFSLIQIAYMQACNIVKHSSVFVSTEDEAIKQHCEAVGVDNVIDRPQELATDNATTHSVICHAVETLKSYDYYITLPPTHPFRIVRSFDLKKFYESGKESGFSGVFDKGVLHFDGRLIRDRKMRQDMPEIQREDGAFYISSKDIVNQEDLVWGDSFMFEGREVIDIHTQEDINIAKSLWSNQWINFKM